MKVESVTQAVSNLALQFGDDDADPGAMVTMLSCRNIIYWDTGDASLFQMNKHEMYSVRFRWQSSNLLLLGNHWSEVLAGWFLLRVDLQRRRGSVISQVSLSSQRYCAALVLRITLLSRGVSLAEIMQRFLTWWGFQHVTSTGNLACCTFKHALVKWTLLKHVHHCVS